MRAVEGGRVMPGVARAVFGLALVPVGLAHFFSVEWAAELVPVWMPFRAILTGFTGAAHIAAGVAIAGGFVPRLAATFEAVMDSLFALIVWSSAVILAPASRVSWMSLLISTALSAAACAVAGSYGARLAPFLADRGTRREQRTARAQNRKRPGSAPSRAGHAHLLAPCLTRVDRRLDEGLMGFDKRRRPDSPPSGMSVGVADEFTDGAAWRSAMHAFARRQSSSCSKRRVGR
jgi:hypothetical protein